MEVWSHLYVAEGAELLIEPNRAGLTSEQVRLLLKRAIVDYQKIKKAKDRKK